MAVAATVPGPSGKPDSSLQASQILPRIGKAFHSWKVRRQKRTIVAPGSGSRVRQDCLAEGGSVCHDQGYSILVYLNLTLVECLRTFLEEAW